MPSATISRLSQVGRKPDLTLVLKPICKTYLVLSGLKRQLTKLEKITSHLGGKGERKGEGRKGERKERRKRERKEEIKDRRKRGRKGGRKEGKREGREEERKEGRKEGRKIGRASCRERV